MLPVAQDPNARPLLQTMAGDIEVSFEFFPPKSDRMAADLHEAVATLASLAPRFVSVTCGAGGSTRDRTREAVIRIARETELRSAAHLTCVGATRAEIDALARAYWAAGVRHIVALRGDPEGPGSHFEPTPDGYANAVELVAALRRIAPFELSVAAYPECHPQSRNRAADLDNLWRKVDAGADRAITQFFFSPDCFFRFRDQAAAVGIDTEIVPGILPIANVAQTRRFAASCGASIPPWMDDLLEGLDERPAARQLVAATLAAELCAHLYAGGVRHFHFYTLNRADLSYAICHLLGLRPAEEAHARCRAA